MSRGRTNTQLMATAQKYAAKLHVAVLKRTKGRVGARMMGSPVFVLVTRGRKSGQRRETPLLYLQDGEDIVAVASNGGAAKAPAWYLNLIGEPRAVALIGGSSLPVVAGEVHGDEKRRLWERLVEMYPPYADYQEKTDRAIPVVVLKPAEQGRSPSTGIFSS